MEIKSNSFLPRLVYLLCKNSVKKLHNATESSRQDQPTRGKLKMLLIYTSVGKRLVAKTYETLLGPHSWWPRLWGKPEASTTYSAPHYSAWRLRAQNLEKLPSPKKQDSRTLNPGSTIDLSAYEQTPKPPVPSFPCHVKSIGTGVGGKLTRDALPNIFVL